MARYPTPDHRRQVPGRQSIEHVRRDGTAVDFTLQTRADGAGTYTTVRTVTGRPNPNGTPQTYTTTSATGRYLRLQVTGLGAAAAETTRHRLQLAEIRIG